MIFLLIVLFILWVILLILGIKLCIESDRENIEEKKEKDYD